MADKEKCKIVAMSAQQSQRKIKRIAFSLLVFSVVGLFLFVLVIAAKLRTHTPEMAYDSLIVALESSDQQKLRELSTRLGLISVQDMTKRYGSKRLSRYLIRHKPVQPYLHAPITSAVLLSDVKSIDVVLFFNWTWDGWKLGSFHGEPIFEPKPGQKPLKSHNKNRPGQITAAPSPHR